MKKITSYSVKRLGKGFYAVVVSGVNPIYITGVQPAGGKRMFWTCEGSPYLPTLRDAVIFALTNKVF